MRDDSAYMQKALALAQGAGERGEVPVGSVVVDAYGTIWGEGANAVEARISQVYHAEMEALRGAAQAKGSWRLEGYTLYVTLEPCTMCIGAIVLSRIERLVYAAPSPLYGYSLDKEYALGLYPRQLRNITMGVCADEATQLLQKYFTKARLT